MYRSLIILPLILCLWSCGPNAESRKVQQEQIDDSLHVTDLYYYRHNKPVLRLDSMRKEYTKKRASLVVAYEQRTKMEKFHLLRSEEEKQKQIQRQNLHIEKLEDSLTSMARSISYLEHRLKMNN